jgi:S-adenosylhomocysteine hydrolase
MPNNETKPKGLAIFLALVSIALISIAATVYGIYTMTSNHIAGPSPPIKTTLALSSNSSTPFSGDTLELAVHVSDNIAGLPITLINNGNSIGVINTDATGTAVFRIAVTAAYDFVANASHASIYGQYDISSNHIIGDTPPVKAMLILCSNSSTPFSGDTLELTVHVSDKTAGIPLTLTNNGVNIAVKNTDATGTAIFHVIVTAAYDFAVTAAHN